MQCPHASIAIAYDSPFTSSMHPTSLTAMSSPEFSYRITHCVTLTRQTQRHFNGPHWEHRYHSCSQCVCFSLPAFVVSTMLLCPCATNFVLTARYLIGLQPRGLPPPPWLPFLIKRVWRKRPQYHCPSHSNLLSQGPPAVNGRGPLLRHLESRKTHWIIFVHGVRRRSVVVGAICRPSAVSTFGSSPSDAGDIHSSSGRQSP